MERSSQPVAWRRRGRASSGWSLSKKTMAAAVCSRARAERLFLRRCQSFSEIARRWAKAWASSIVLTSLRLIVCGEGVVGSIVMGRVSANC